MARVKRVREVVTTPPTAEDLRQRAEQGWRLVAIEWEREAQEERAGGLATEEVPYGLEVSPDHLHLIENPTEVEVMRCLLEQVVLDRPLSEAAEELNRRGFRQRSGARWTQVALFNLLPRVVEVAPKIYSSEEWAEKRAHLRIVG